MALDLSKPNPTIKNRQHRPKPRSTLLFGAAGSGKSRTVAELMMRDEVLFMFHCGLGAASEETFESYLAARLGSLDDALELIARNLRMFEVNSPAELGAICKDPTNFLRNYIADETFFTRLTTVVVEEFNGAQGLYERELTPVGNSGLPQQTLSRKADKSSGSDGSYGHYANIKMGTEYLTSKFMLLPYKHVWTAHETINAAGEGELGPMVQTKAINGFVGAFSFSIHLERERDKFAGKEDDPYTYWYNFKNSKYSKARIENCPHRLKADPAELWDLIRF